MKLKGYFVEDIPRRKFLELSLKGGLALAATPALLRNLLAGQAPARPELAFEDLNKVIRRALSQGGEFGEVYVENRISRSILLEEGKFKSAVFGISQGAGVRVISGDKTGYAYTDEITQEKIIRAAEVASFVARGAKTVKPVDIKAETRPSYITVKVPLQTVADEKRLEIMKRAHDAALAYDARIKMASINYYDEVRSRVIANSEGPLPERRAAAPLLHRPDARRRQQHLPHGTRAAEPALRDRDVRRAQARGRGPDLRPGIHRHARGQGCSGREDGRGHAERLGRRPRPRGRRPSARRRTTSPGRPASLSASSGRKWPTRSSPWSMTAPSPASAARQTSTTRGLR